MVETLLWTKQKNSTVRCELCAHLCLIKPGKRGICHVRENQGGELVSLVYGRLLSAAVDPIEKKPLYHFLPGSQAFSICTAGCNFGCLFCQNADISQGPKSGVRDNISGDFVEPAALVDLAMRHECQNIAYTYTEPTIFMEYALDTAKLAKAKGIKNIFVTNGYMTSAAIDLISPYLDAVNIDLKSFCEEFYHRYCRARLASVLRSIEQMHESGIWIELTTLLIPGLNDGAEELKRMTHWIAELDTNIPWHVSAFRPAYMMQDIPPTPAETIYQAVEIGKKAGLKFVYAGNLAGTNYSDTICPDCGEVVIKRRGYDVKNLMIGCSCPSCKYKMPGIF